MSDTFNIDKARHEVEAKRSNVRRWVTLWVVGAYLVMAGFAMLFLFWQGRHEIALGILAGVSGLTGSIVGFWFGARKPKEEKDETPTSTQSKIEVGDPVKVTGPIICHLTEAISAQAIKDMKATPDKKQSIRAKLSETERTLLGSASIDGAKIKFIFEKVQSKNVVSPLTRALTGETAVPSGGAAFDASREILLS